MESPEVKSLQVLRGGLDTLQVNLGYRCNQACAHCHVNAGPNRTEEMTYKTIDLILKILKKERIRSLDLTGGAPELNPNFKYFVSEATDLGVSVIDRCNLTVLLEPGQADLPLFFAKKK